jgi:hypothetical protein
VRLGRRCYFLPQQGAANLAQSTGVGKVHLPCGSFLAPLSFTCSAQGLKLVAQFNRRIRLVRLRPEFAKLYPALDPDVWATATELAARLLAQHAVQPSAGFMLNKRVLPEEHFEFQGGDPRGGSWSGPPSRRTDHWPD